MFPFLVQKIPEHKRAVHESLKETIKKHANDIDKVSLELKVWPDFLDERLKGKGGLRKMKEGPNYFVWDDKNKKALAWFNMDSPVSCFSKYHTNQKNIHYDF